jgi:hypothetical protein
MGRDGGVPPSSSTSSSDDLLFFVHTEASMRLCPEGLDRDSAPYSVRRRGSQLAPEWQRTGSLFEHVAWDRTLLLNLVLQGHYTLTTAVCRWGGVRVRLTKDKTIPTVCTVDVCNQG